MCFYLTSTPGQMGNRCGKPGQMQSLAGFLGCCARLFSSQLGTFLFPFSEGTWEQMTS